MVSGMSKQSYGDRIFTFIIYIFLTFSVMIILYPLIYIVSASVSSADAVLGGKVWLLPVQPTIIGYETIFQSKLIMSGYANSFFYTIVGTAVNVVITIMAAYPLSKRNCSGKAFL